MTLAIGEDMPRAATRDTEMACRFHQLWETIFVAVSSHSEGVAPSDQAAKDLARDFSTEIG